MPDFFGQTKPSNWIEENFQSKKSILLDASICCYDFYLSGFPTLSYRLSKKYMLYSDKKAGTKSCAKKCAKTSKERRIVQEKI